MSSISSNTHILLALLFKKKIEVFVQDYSKFQMF